MTTTHRDEAYYSVLAENEKMEDAIREIVKLDAVGATDTGGWVHDIGFIVFGEIFNLQKESLDQESLDFLLKKNALLKTAVGEFKTFANYVLGKVGNLA